MSTPYSAIHNIAIGKFMDFDMLKFNEDDREEILNRFLKSAIVDFLPICKEDLSTRDEGLQEFAADLPDDVMEILAAGEAYYWLKPRVNNLENFRNLMSTKDFSFFSNANLLNALQALSAQLENEFRRKMYLYSYRKADMSSMNA